MWGLWEAWERQTVRTVAQWLQAWGQLAAAADKQRADARREAP